MKHSVPAQTENDLIDLSKRNSHAQLFQSGRRHRCAHSQRNGKARLR